MEHMASKADRAHWVHTPTRFTLLWLVISLPLVIWDTGYVLLRPHSMPRGRFHSPIWTPYALYGEVDYIYGWPAYDSRNGFTAAQSSLNVVETVGYLIYLWTVWRKGSGKSRTLEGGWGGVACLAGFALSVMTVSKTLLYVMNEICSGWDNVGHNSLRDLIMMWIVPNGSWLVFPTYMAFTFATDILQGLAIASGDSSSVPAKVADELKLD